MSDELRLANGLTVADVAMVEMRLQERIDTGDLILVEGVGYVSRQLLLDDALAALAPDTEGECDV